MRALLHLGFGNRWLPPLWERAYPRRGQPDQHKSPAAKNATAAATALGNALRQALLIIDMQPSFAPSQWLIDGIQALIGTLPGDLLPGGWACAV